METPWYPSLFECPTMGNVMFMIERREPFCSMAINFRQAISWRFYEESVELYMSIKGWVCILHGLPDPVTSWISRHYSVFQLGNISLVGTRLGLVFWFVRKQDWMSLENKFRSQTLFFLLSIGRRVTSVRTVSWQNWDFCVNYHCQVVAYHSFTCLFSSFWQWWIGSEKVSFMFLLSSSKTHKLVRIHVSFSMNMYSVTLVG